MLKKDSSGNNVTITAEDIELGRGNIGISFGGIDKKHGSFEFTYLIERKMVLRVKQNLFLALV